MSFQVLGTKYAKRRKAVGPAVTIDTKHRLMRFNKEATDRLMAQGTKILVWWDAELRQMAFSGAAPDRRPEAQLSSA